MFPEDTLFFALKSERRSGLAFIDELYSRGVRNFVVDEKLGTSKFGGANILYVNDVLTSLQQLAAYNRSCYNIPVIGITGSNGKTIVKEWLNQLLIDKYNIVRSPRSYNSQIGVPLSVWQMNEMHELAIFEAGISQQDEMAALAAIIRPTIGIFTNIGPAHNEGFDSYQSKISEKLLLFSNVEVLIYCRDHQLVDEAINESEIRSKTKLFHWSAHKEASLRIKNILKDRFFTSIEGIFEDREIAIRIPYTDQASIENAIHCWSLLLYMKMSDEMIASGMLHLPSVAMRLELKKGINNCSIINDSYSSDLSSLEIALDFLVQQQQHKQRTVVLTDILQSGVPEEFLYKKVARSLKLKNVNRLIGIGHVISRYAPIFNAAGIRDCSFYPSVDNLREHFSHVSFHDEVILFKGARKFGLEEIVHLLEEKVHQTIMEINLNSLLHNLHQYQQLLRPTTRIMAMVKAFSYGSGSFEIANVLQFNKVDYLAVAYTDEGIDLRKGGIRLPIMVMNADASGFESLVEYNLEPDIYSLSFLKGFDAFLKQEGVQDFPVHIELETGMNRLGFDMSEVDEMVQLLKNGNCVVRSVFTHLVASEDEHYDNFTNQQADKFLQTCELIREGLGYDFLKHIANSSGITRHRAIQFDMVRLGIGLYGIQGSPNPLLRLLEVSTLRSTIAQIKHIKKGETVGYGRKGVTDHDALIATVRIGYADGYPRVLSNGKGKMLVRGKLAPVIGTICMDMTMIEITGIDDVKEGDDVIVFGQDLPVTTVAEWAGTIPYEILTGVSQRVKRVYYQE